jgi:hypothetical protein
LWAPGSSIIDGETNLACSDHRLPLEYKGTALSGLRIEKVLGWLSLSMAGQPTSVNQIGFDCGTQAVGRAGFTPSGRL